MELTLPKTKTLIVERQTSLSGRNNSMPWANSYKAFLIASPHPLPTHSCLSRKISDFMPTYISISTLCSRVRYAAPPSPRQPFPLFVHTVYRAEQSCENTAFSKQIASCFASCFVFCSCTAELFVMAVAHFGRIIINL